MTDVINSAHNRPFTWAEWRQWIEVHHDEWISQAPQREMAEYMYKIDGLSARLARFVDCHGVCH